jgi:thioredoxin 1
MTGLPLGELTDEAFHREIVGAGQAAVVEFWAGWCPYSRLLRPKLERLHELYGDRLLVRRLEVDRHPAAAASIGLEYIPALVFFRGGRAVRRLYGDRHLAELVARVERFRTLD